MRNMQAKCGTDCAACSFREEHHCDGCPAQAGKPFWGECDIYRCAASRNLPHCGVCPEFPCAELLHLIETGLSPHRMENLRRWRVETRCGLQCSTCTYREPNHCPGCVTTDGHPYHGECPVAICCQKKGLTHCGECPDLPCKLLRDYSCDPEHGDTPPGARIERCRMWAERFIT